MTAAAELRQARETTVRNHYEAETPRSRWAVGDVLPVEGQL
jgi:hypothetical protein